MDRIDYAILRILKENARESASNIGRGVHLSVPAVLERIRKLEEGGVIKNYTVAVDASRLGNDVTALMEISLEQPRFFDGFTEAILKNNKIVSCYYLTGDFDFTLTISCASSEELERVHRFIKEIPGVSKTRTHYVLKEVKNIYASIPEEEGEKA